MSFRSITFPKANYSVVFMVAHTDLEVPELRYLTPSLRMWICLPPERTCLDVIHRTAPETPGRGAFLLILRFEKVPTHLLSSTTTLLCQYVNRAPFSRLLSFPPTRTLTIDTFSLF